MLLILSKVRINHDHFFKIVYIIKKGNKECRYENKLSACKKPDTAL